MCAPKQCTHIIVHFWIVKRRAIVFAIATTHCFNSAINDSDVTSNCSTLSSSISELKPTPRQSRRHIMISFLWSTNVDDGSATQQCRLRFHFVSSATLLIAALVKSNSTIRNNIKPDLWSQTRLIKFYTQSCSSQDTKVQTWPLTNHSSKEMTHFKPDLGSKCNSNCLFLEFRVATSKKNTVCWWRFYSFPIK